MKDGCLHIDALIRAELFDRPIFNLLLLDYLRWLQLRRSKSALCQHTSIESMRARQTSIVYKGVDATKVLNDMLDG